MALFRLNDEPIKFNLIDIEDDERFILEELIKDQGGECTDNEESVVKFTSTEGFGKKHYPRAKIYDVEFILECVKQEKIVEPEQFRLSRKVSGDEYIIEHFLFGRCSSNRNNNLRRIASPTSSLPTAQAAIDSQEHVTSPETDETMFTALSTEQSSPVVDEHVDESQMVVVPSDLRICAPTLAGGDAAKATTASHEKRPCNLEYELVVQPKMAALESEARKLTATKENNAENRQLQRSLRTRTRRSHITQSEALQETSASNSENVDPEIVRVKEEPISILSDSGPNNVPDKMSYMKLKADPEKIVASPSKFPVRSDSGWIETKTGITKGNVSKMLSNAVVPANRKTKIEKLAVPTDGSKVLNVCYKGLNAAGASLKHTGEPVLSKAPKRKHAHEKSSDEANTSKRKEKNNERRESFGSERNTSKCNGRKAGRKTSEDEENVIKKKMKNRKQTMHSDEDGNARPKAKDRAQELSDEDEEISDRRKVKEPSVKTYGAKCKQGMRRLLNLDEEQNSFIISKKKPSKSPTLMHPDDSSDFSLHYSSDEEVPKKKRFRKKYVNDSDSSDQIISDESSTEENPQRLRNTDLNEAGPSGVRNITRDFYVERGEESSDDDSHAGPNLPRHQKTGNNSNSRHKRLEKAGDCKHLVVQKLEHHSTITTSRGQLWRSQLSTGYRTKTFRSGPFNPSERRMMIKYLLDTKCIDKAKGLVIWKEMIDDGYLIHRTPQSLHNQFQKHILPNIDDFHDLKPAEKQQFLVLRTEKSERGRK